MPVPYGLLPHELIEIVDNERILPGISYLYKLGEDFPYLNLYNFQNLESDDFKNWHQRALLFVPADSLVQAKPYSGSMLVRMIRKYKLKHNPCDKLLTFKDFHSIRYTFISNLF